MDIFKPLQNNKKTVKMGEVHKKKVHRKNIQMINIHVKRSQNKYQSGKCKFKQQLDAILSSTKSPKSITLTISNLEKTGKTPHLSGNWHNPSGRQFDSTDSCFKCTSSLPQKSTSMFPRKIFTLTQR